jgi:hypothetical protein
MFHPGCDVVDTIDANGTMDPKLLFQRARKVLSEDEIEDLGGRLEEAKKVPMSATAG